MDTIRTSLGALLLALTPMVRAGDSLPPSNPHRLPMPLDSGTALTTADLPVTDSLLLPMVGASDHLDGRIAFLATELKITPAQLPLWNAFVAAVRANAAEDQQLEAGQLQASLSAVLVAAPGTPDLLQRLQARQRRLARSLQMLQRMIGALTPLYESFSTEQRLLAESLANGTAGL